MIKKLCLAAVLLIGLVGTRVRAEATDKQIPPQADKIIKTICGAYKELESYSGSMQAILKISMPDSKISIKEVLRIAFVRPNKVYLFHEFILLSHLIVVSDGTTLWTYNQAFNQYSQEKAPDKVSLDTVSVFKARSIKHFHFALIVDLIFARDSYTGFVKPFTSVKYIGTEKLGGKDMLVLQGRAKFMDDDKQVEGTARLWVGKEDFLIYRIKSNTTCTLPAEKSPTGKKIRLREEFDMLCSHEVIDQAIDQEVFTFTPPTNSQQIEKIGTPTPSGKSGETYAMTVEPKEDDKPKLKPPDEPKPPRKLILFKVLGTEKKVVFVLDCSPSTEPDVLRPELIGAIKALAEDCSFNVVSFGPGIKSWKDQLTVASLAKKQSASEWVCSRRVDGFSTIIYGLERAMTYKPEVVYVITDGRCMYPKRMTTEFPSDKITARVNWVYFDRKVNRYYIKTLQDLAKRTKGRFIPLVGVRK